MDEQTPVIDHTQLPKERWQEILNQALNDWHSSGGTDEEAHQAIQDATDALNAYDQPAIAAGENVGESGFGKVLPAIQGLGDTATGIVKGLGQLAFHPIKTAKAVVADPLAFPRSVAQGITSGDPRQIARSVGDVGSLFLPAAKIRAGGPSVAAVAGRAVSAPFRAAGSLMARPGLRNAEIAARTAAEEARRALAAGREAERVAGAPHRLAAAQSRATIAGTQAAAAAPKMATQLAQMSGRLQLIEQALERGPATAENLALRNELLKIRLQMMQSAAAEGGAADVAAAGGEAVPEGMVVSGPKAPNVTGAEPTGPVSDLTGKQYGQTAVGPPTPPVPTTPTIAEMLGTAGTAIQPEISPEMAALAKSLMTEPFEESAVPAMQLGPRAAASDIETYLRQIASRLQHGYGAK